MRIPIICPKCGCRPVYSQALAETICKIVSEYFRITVYDCKTVRRNTGIEGRARAFTLYFIRCMTGEQYKVVGKVFLLSGERAAFMVSRLEAAVETKRTYSNQEQAIRELLLNDLPAQALTVKPETKTFKE